MSSDILWPRDAIISLCEMAQTLTILWDPRDATYVRHKLRQKCFTDLTNLTGGNLIIMIFDSLSLLNNDDHGQKNRYFPDKRGKTWVLWINLEQAACGTVSEESLLYLYVTCVSAVFIIKYRETGIFQIGRVKREFGVNWPVTREFCCAMGGILGFRKLKR